ncbi:MAG: type II toxin-antitoxin system PemK/MazF family toxin [Patescibacteria group bacterium]
MEKDFQKWHSFKEDLHRNAERVLFHEREVWWCALGANVGFEQDGKNDTFERPVIVFRKFNKEVFWALPITTQEKSGKYYFSYTHDGKRFSIILSQMRLLDGKRLLRKVTTLPNTEFQELDMQFHVLVKQTIPPLLAGSRRPKPFMNQV